MSRFYRHTGLHPLARLKAWHRTLVAILIGLLVMAWMPQGLWETRLLAAWLAASAIYQITLWWGLWRLDADQTKHRAHRLDPGARSIYTLLLITLWISLVGVLLLADAARAMSGMERWLHILLALSALASNWLMLQSIFAIRYTHNYYHPTAQGDAMGLGFPGEHAPCYMDFAYFSVVIGMTAQVADVTTTSTAMRRLVLLHGIVSFAFNVMVLALTLNLLASALG